MGFGDIINFFFNSKNKLKNGIHQLNYKNGNIMILGKVRKGRKVGVWKTFYENGILKSRGAYDSGQKLVTGNIFMKIHNLSRKSFIKILKEKVHGPSFIKMAI